MDITDQYHLLLFVCCYRQTTEHTFNASFLKIIRAIQKWYSFQKGWQKPYCEKLCEMGNSLAKREKEKQENYFQK